MRILAGSGAFVLICLLAVGQTEHDKPSRVICTYPKMSTIHRVSPVYPEAAKKAGIHGKVTLRVFVGKDGLINEIKETKGEPILVQAAVDAVSNWKFRPFKLNSKAVEVETTISVNFEPLVGDKKSSP